MSLFSFYVGATCQISWGRVLLSKTEGGAPSAAGHCLPHSSLFPAFLLGWEGREVSVHELLKLLANCSRIWQKGWGCGQIRKQGHAERGERSDLQQHFGSADALLQQLSVKPRERSSCCWRPPEGDPARLNPSA